MSLSIVVVMTPVPRAELAGMVMLVSVPMSPSSAELRCSVTGTTVAEARVREILAVTVTLAPSRTVVAEAEMDTVGGGGAVKLSSIVAPDDQLKPALLQVAVSAELSMVASAMAKLVPSTCRTKSRSPLGLFPSMPNVSRSPALS